MEDLLVKLEPSLLVVIVISLLWLLKFLFKDVWESKKKETEKRDFLLSQNTIALTELRVELKNLKELFLGIHAKQDKIEKDINALHKSRREELKG